MQPTSADRLKAKLTDYIDEDGRVTNMSGALEVLHLLENLVVSKDILESTRLGMLVNNIRRQNQVLFPDIARHCKKLIKNWQKLISPGTPSGSTHASPNVVAGGLGQKMLTPSVRFPLTPKGKPPHQSTGPPGQHTPLVAGGGGTQGEATTPDPGIDPGALRDSLHKVLSSPTLAMSEGSQSGDGRWLNSSSYAPRPNPPNASGLQEATTSAQGGMELMTTGQSPPQPSPGAPHTTGPSSVRLKIKIGSTLCTVTPVSTAAIQEAKEGQGRPATNGGAIVTAGNALGGSLLFTPAPPLRSTPSLLADDLDDVPLSQRVNLLSNSNPSHSASSSTTIPQSSTSRLLVNGEVPWTPPGGAQGVLSEHPVNGRGTPLGGATGPSRPPSSSGGGAPNAMTMLDNSEKTARLKTTAEIVAELKKPKLPSPEPEKIPEKSISEMAETELSLRKGKPGGLAEEGRKNSTLDQKGEERSSASCSSGSKTNNSHEIVGQVEPTAKRKRHASRSEQQKTLPEKKRFLHDWYADLLEPLTHEQLLTNDEDLSIGSLAPSDGKDGVDRVKDGIDGVKDGNGRVKDGNGRIDGIDGSFSPETSVFHGWRECYEKEVGGRKLLLLPYVDIGRPDFVEFDDYPSQQQLQDDWVIGTTDAF